MEAYGHASCLYDYYLVHHQPNEVTGHATTPFPMCDCSHCNTVVPIHNSILSYTYIHTFMYISVHTRCTTVMTQGYYFILKSRVVNNFNAEV